MTDSGVKIVMGGGGILNSKPSPRVPDLLSVLASHKVTTIDSAVLYGASEELLGENKAGENFTIDTKHPGGAAADKCGRDAVIAIGKESIRKLQVKQVDVFYIHTPVTQSPIADTLAGMNELYQLGLFRRLGLSNFRPAQVQEAYDICQTRGYPLPKVYQGNYNAFARSYEQSLFPLLRKLGMSFYAYSPQAGGFLSKTTQLIEARDGEGRFLGHTPLSDMYRTLYTKPKLLDGLTKWNDIAKEAGIKPGDMAVRWVKYNSILSPDLGDGVIIGGRTVEQVDDMLSMLETGPLPRELLPKIDEVWELVKDDAPMDNYNDFLRESLEASK